MTVVATVITRHFTALASDSFITVARPDGSRKVVANQESKLINVPAWRGAMAYWDLARFGDWNTKRWLEAQANGAGGHGCAENYAHAIADSLTLELRRRAPTDSGLGIHFTAYERVDEYWIPELFVVTNWTDPSYSEMMPSGFAVTRETDKTLHRLAEISLEEQRKPNNRRAVHAALHEHPLMFRFNNGDPRLFNPIAESIFTTFLTLYGRGHVHDSSSAQTHLSLVRRPVEVVSKLLADLASPRSRIIGGRPHDLAISPNGAYESTSGD